MQITYYDVIGALREYPERSLMVFDLGGITHFFRQNQFPVTWTPDETALLISKCYDPERWDVYWTIPPCPFVMKRLEAEGLFKGSPELLRRHGCVRSRAIRIAYLQHRATFTWRFLADANLTLAEHRLEDQHNAPLMNDRHLQARARLARGAQDQHPVPLGLLAAAGGSGMRARLACARDVLGRVCHCRHRLGRRLCAELFGLLGVAAEFRYGYWCVLATLAGLVTAFAARREPSARPAAPSSAAQGAA